MILVYSAIVVWRIQNIFRIMADNKLRFETKQIHGGYHVDHTGSRGIAIYPTAAYHFKSCDYAARLFELSEGGNIYTRLQNPTSSAYGACGCIV